MILAALVFNNDGKARLMKWYQPGISTAAQHERLKAIHALIKPRADHSCNFLEGEGETRIVYRHYATLYFVFVVDSSESELGILDLIQVFVEALDTVFTNVCELDLIFRPDDVLTVLSEIISGGLVLEVDLESITGGLQLGKTRARHR